MAIALHTAALAVSAYLKEDSYAYHSRARKELLPQMQRAVWLMKFISSPLHQKVLLNVCRIMPHTLAFLAKKTRLTVTGQTV